MESINRKTTFNALLCFVDAALSSECPASEIHLVPHHVHIPLCKDQGFPTFRELSKFRDVKAATNLDKACTMEPHLAHDFSYFVESNGIDGLG